MSVQQEEKKQRAPKHFWSFTWNNWSEEERRTVHQILLHECVWFVYQEEIGEQGTPHLQGTIKLKDKKRLTALKKFHSKISWRETNSVSAQVAYCTKIESRSGEQYVHGISIPKQVKTHEPRGWQLKVMEIIAQEPDERSIHWFWESTGSVGKSQLAKYLGVHHGGIKLNGKARDMYHQLSKYPNPRLIVVDIPRDNIGYINYGAMEEMKNGYVFSGKFDGCQLIFDPPHVIVFANIMPDVTTMSLDRWCIYNVEDLIKQETI